MRRLPRSHTLLRRGYALRPDAPLMRKGAHLRSAGHGRDNGLGSLGTAANDTSMIVQIAAMYVKSSSAGSIVFGINDSTVSSVISHAATS